MRLPAILLCRKAMRIKYIMQHTNEAKPVMRKSPQKVPRPSWLEETATLLLEQELVDNH